MIRNINFLKSMPRFGIMRQNYSNDSSRKDLPSNYVIINEDMIVCWHPEPKFPYECSKPLPPKQPKAESVLKMSEQAARKVFVTPKNTNEERAANAEELAKLTYTTKHRWFPKSRTKYYKKIEPDRPYL